jgi:cytoskeleton protein RodZ
MPEIGSTLREARMRARIDITEVEQATKIRAKYLRAIENEEWGLLPGSTFVKSFIREYAEFLDLDARSLVEEYKLRYERPSESELRAVSPGLSRDRGRSRGLGGGRGGGGGGSLPRWVITVGLLAIIVVALFVVGKLGGDDDKGGATTPVTRESQTQTQPRRGSGHRRRAQTPQSGASSEQAGLRLTPTGDVFVCLVDQDGNAMISGTIFRAGETVPLQRARAMRLTLGNGNVQLRVNGRAVEVPGSTEPIGFAISPSGARPLPRDQQPLCT